MRDMRLLAANAHTVRPRGAQRGGRGKEEGGMRFGMKV